jgi:hypothetical protein
MRVKLCNAARRNGRTYRAPPRGRERPRNLDPPARVSSREPARSPLPSSQAQPVETGCTRSPVLRFVRRRTERGTASVGSDHQPTYPTVGDDCGTSERRPRSRTSGTQAQAPAPDRPPLRRALHRQLRRWCRHPRTAPPRRSATRSNERARARIPNREAAPVQHPIGWVRQHDPRRTVDRPSFSAKVAVHGRRETVGQPQRSGSRSTTAAASPPRLVPPPDQAGDPGIRSATRASSAAPSGQRQGERETSGGAIDPFGPLRQTRIVDRWTSGDRRLSVPRACRHPRDASEPLGARVGPALRALAAREPKLPRLEHAHRRAPRTPVDTAYRTPQMLGMTRAENPPLDRNARYVPANYGNRPRPPSLEFRTLRRFQRRAATYTGVASPSYAAPSGFLNLLTLCSARDLSGLVSCR